MAAKAYGGADKIRESFVLNPPPARMTGKKYAKPSASERARGTYHRGQFLSLDNFLQNGNSQEPVVAAMNIKPMSHIL